MADMLKVIANMNENPLIIELNAIAEMPDISMTAERAMRRDIGKS